MKKKWLLTTLLLIALRGIAQPDLHYVQQAVFLSENPISGTARFRALAGSMGALGGDISAAVENPAGLAVFLSPEAILTAGLNTHYNRAGFYDDAGRSNLSDAFNFNFNQAALVFSFALGDKLSADRLAFAVNYQRTADYGQHLYIGAPEAPIIFSITDIDQKPKQVQFNAYRQTQSGSKDAFDFIGAFRLQRWIYFGLSFNVHSILYSHTYAGYDFPTATSDSQGVQLTEVKTHEYTQASGFSATAGMLCRTPLNLRFGFSYTSPQWYAAREDFTDPENGDPAHADYPLRTYDSWGASVAYVFGKSGFVNFDYHRRAYRWIHLGENGAFSRENQSLASWIHSTSNVRIGLEKRFQGLRFRLGGRWAQSPYGSKPGYPSIGDLWAAAAGLGCRFSSAFSLDFSYDYTYRKRGYIISYGNLQPVIITDPVQLEMHQSNILLSMRYRF